MIKRLRPPHSPEQLRRIYTRPHDHRLYGRGHHERVEEMVRLGLTAGDVGSVADLSCGNAEVANRMHAATRYLGDIAPGYEFTGPIEETLGQIPAVGMFILGETLEHLDDPAKVLYRIAKKSDLLLLSTPLDAWDDTNAEHYWAWSRDDVEALLLHGWSVIREFSAVDSRTYGEPYLYGVWLVAKE